MWDRTVEIIGKAYTLLAGKQKLYVTFVKWGGGEVSCVCTSVSSVQV